MDVPCNGSGQITVDVQVVGEMVLNKLGKTRINIPAGVDTGTKRRVSGEEMLAKRWSGRSLCLCKG